MKEADAPPPKSARVALLRIFIVFVITFDLAFMGQKAAGAYESEFGAHPDEAAHCVTGIFVRDALVEGWNYARAGFPGPIVATARAFADNFYLHYPKVALGVWPPGFHLAQAVWTLPFGPSRFSLLLLMAGLAAATATLVFEVARRYYGQLAASAAALLWLCAPLVREHTGILMAELLSTLTMFAATVAWGRYLDRARAWDVVAFALCASAAIMTKGTGLALGLMCGCSMALTRNWRLFARPSLWAAVVVVVLLAGVWTWTFRHEGARVGGWEQSRPSWDFTSAAVPFYTKALIQAAGFAVAGFACAGMLGARRISGVWSACLCLVFAVLLFQWVMPVGKEARHIVTATPALVLLAVGGVFAIARHRLSRVEDRRLQIRRERLWLLLLVILALAESIHHFERKSFHGFEPLASEVLDLAPPGSRVLVCSDASGEGMLISELAMRDARPNLIVERGSKSLVDAQGRTWAGTQLRERFADDAALLDYLRRSKIAFVVLDSAVPEDKRVGYHDQLRRVIKDHTGLFWPVAESPVRREGEDLAPPLQLYRIVRDEQAREISTPPIR